MSALMNPVNVSLPVKELSFLRESWYPFNEDMFIQGLGLGLFPNLVSLSISLMPYFSGPVSIIDRIFEFWQGHKSPFIFNWQSDYISIKAFSRMLDCAVIKNGVQVHAALSKTHPVYALIKNETVILFSVSGLAILSVGKHLFIF